MEINVVSLKVVRDKKVKFPVEAIKSPADAAEVLKRFIGDRDREHMVVMMLDTKNQITALHVSAIGSLNSAIIHPRETFKAAIVHNSAGIVIAHNHPSGVPEPSLEDIDTTKRLQLAGELIGIKLLDHIIVSDDRYISFKEQGLI